MTSYEDFFKKFLHEYRLGLRIEEQPFLDKLIQDLTDISQIFPPHDKNQYGFREILMLTMLINQKKIHAYLEKKNK